MRKSMSLMLAVWMLTMLLVPAAGADAVYAWVKTGNGKTLNMRERPDGNARIVRQLAYRTKVLVHETYGAWSLVEPTDWSMSNPMWVKSAYLVPNDPGPYDPQPSGDAKYKEIDNAVKAMTVLDAPYPAVIKTTKPQNVVHLRWVPHTAARYIAEYLRGTEILVLAESRTWAQVQVVADGYVGFILHSCVEPVEEEIVEDGLEG